MGRDEAKVKKMTSCSCCCMRQPYLRVSNHKFLVVFSVLDIFKFEVSSVLVYLLFKSNCFRSRLTSPLIKELVV
jgi:hypothetical protein